MMEELIGRLKKSLKGEVRDDPVTRRVYSVDASIFEIEPLCVVTPRDREDVIALAKIANEQGIPLVPRGAATGITGGCIGKGIVVDLAKYLNRIKEVNWDSGYVVCEPGVVQDQLNSVLAEKGYRLGPDTSTGNRATLGGMLANNAAGSRSLKYGRMVDDVLETEVVLSGGVAVRFSEKDEVAFAEKCALPDREGIIYRTIDRIRNEYRDDIEKGFPKIPRRVSGYNLDELIKGGAINLSKLIAGSEGTLGIVTEIKMRIAPVPKHTGLCIVHFDEMIAGMAAIDEMLAFSPIAVEMIDKNIIDMGRLSPSVHDKLDWLSGDPKAVFAIEIEADTEKGVEERLAQMQQTLKEKKIGYAQILLTDPKMMSHIWQVRKAGLGLLMSKRSYSRAVAFIEDITVDPARLKEFMSKYLDYMKAIGKEAGIYGHVGSGCMHIRPYMDMRKESELQLMEKIMQDVAQMLIEHNGALSGEHGDGLVRSWLNLTLFGERLYRAFIELKQAFDPENRMNPGKIVFPEPFEKNRRLDPETPIREIVTFQDFSREGGFALAVDMCNGNAQCRKPEGTMCPSFQASNDEYHTTRARAQTLRAITTGRLPFDEFTGEGLRDVLDLCIECKGCKNECPSQVDMAKMKAEFLYHYQKKHGYTLRDRMFAFIGTINSLTAPFASIANWTNDTFLTKQLLKALGIAPERKLPALAKTRFSKWAKNHPSAASEKQVVLFNDTFTEFNEPSIGIAATHLLEALGYAVIIPQWQCCGRTLISKGFLQQAKKYAEALTKTLVQYANQNIPIIGLEPSCILTIKDDFQGLLGYGNNTLNKILPHCYTLDEFLAINTLNLPFNNNPKLLKLHGHCHQKALTGTSHTLNVLNSLPNATVEEIPTGCCGMAGSFGYEKEHYKFSLKIAQQQLVPSLQNLPQNTTVIANGFSCRHQIQHLTPHKPLHLAEALHSFLNS